MYAGEIFNFRSRQTKAMTSCPSAPSALARQPISLAKATLRAWNALHEYLTSAAVRVSVTICSASMES